MRKAWLREAQDSAILFARKIEIDEGRNLRVVHLLE